MKLLQAVCEAMEPLKFEYVHNLSMLMGEHQREELTEYVKAAVTPPTPHLSLLCLTTPCTTRSYVS